jgi:hypothetical protein
MIWPQTNTENARLIDVLIDAREQVDIALTIIILVILNDYHTFKFSHFKLIAVIAAEISSSTLNVI